MSAGAFFRQLAAGTAEQQADLLGIAATFTLVTRTGFNPETQAPTSSTETVACNVIRDATADVRRPAGQAELPAHAITLLVERAEFTGAGREPREGDRVMVGSRTYTILTATPLPGEATLQITADAPSPG